MAISRVQFTQGANAASAVNTQATSNFGSNVTSGNLIVVITRSDTDNISSVTDTLGTTYMLRVTGKQGDANPTIAIYSGVAGSTGTNAVTVVWGDSKAYRWVFAIEYSPGANTWSSPYDTGDGESGTGVTDLVSGAITTAQAEEVVVLGASQSALASYTAGTDFTLVDGTIGTGGQDYGGVEEYITSGTLSTYVSHITSNVTNAYAVAVAAFKTTAGGGGGGLVGPLMRGRLIRGGALRGVLVR